MSKIPERAPPAPHPRRPYPFWLGGVAASCAGAITHPLDLTKVRLQTSEDKKMIQSFRRTVGTYGVRGLYDGLTGTLLRQMTYSLMRFAAYDHIKAELHQGPGPPPAWKLALAGSCAGGIAGMIGNPAELMMVRMQADRGKPAGQRYGYRNSVQGLYRMAAEEGVSSWFRGVVPNGVRSVLMNASQLGSYDWFKHQLLGLSKLEDGPAVHFLASIGAGTVATTVCSPADVIKSRIMNAHDNAGLVKVITESVAKEGPGVFFKGWLPAWIRLQPTSKKHAGKADTSHPHLPHARAAQGGRGQIPPSRRDVAVSDSIWSICRGEEASKCIPAARGLRREGSRADPRAPEPAAPHQDSTGCRSKQ